MFVYCAFYNISSKITKLTRTSRSFLGPCSNNVLCIKLFKKTGLNHRKDITQTISMALICLLKIVSTTKTLKCPLFKLFLTKLWHCRWPFFLHFTSSQKWFYTIKLLTHIQWRRKYFYFIRSTNYPN